MGAADEGPYSASRLIGSGQRGSQRVLLVHDDLCVGAPVEGGKHQHPAMFE
jgi:hypothetical protein